MIRFHFSMQGTFYTLGGFLFLAIGFFREEIFSIICGIVLVSFFLFSLLSLFTTLLFWKKKQPELIQTNQSFFVRTTASSIKRGEKTNYKKQTFPFVFPGTTVFYFLEYHSSRVALKEKEFSISIPLKKYQRPFIEKDFPRGFYILKKKALVLTDIAHFFSIKIFLPDTQLIQNYYVPSKPDRTASFFLPKIIQYTAEKKNNAQRDDEFYETRPYFPGDDTRKINWKIYAHKQEITIRQGDFSPPPQQHFTLYVEEPYTSKKTTTEMQEAFDIFINRVEGFALWLHEQNICFTVISQTHNKKEPLQERSILPLDKNAPLMLQEAFSHPQIQTEEKFTTDISFLLQKMEKKFCLLYFFMSDKNSAHSNRKIKEVSRLFDSLVCYTGPLFFAEENKSKIKNFLYTSKKERHKTMVFKEISDASEKITKAQQGALHAFAF